jgi:subtilisin family serine protease/subtilisin-like proprotein convertase family protein
LGMRDGEVRGVRGTGSGPKEAGLAAKGGEALEVDEAGEVAGEKRGGAAVSVLTGLAADKAATKAKRVGAGVALDAPLVAGRQWRMSVGGKPVVMEVALDEIWIAGAKEGGGVRSIPAQPDLELLLASAEALAASLGGKARLVLYPRGTVERTELNRRLLTESFLVEWDGRAETRRKLEAAGVRDLKQPDYAPELWVARVEGDPAAPLRAMEALESTPGLPKFEPQLARQQQKKAVPNDTLFTTQWHLRNTGQGSGRVGVDANVVDVWDTRKGSGIQIAVVDDGVDFAHPDLAPNRAATGHFNWNDGDPNDPSPGTDVDLEDFHGTSVAGVAAARGDNGIGVSGAAPLASLVGFRLISAPSTDADEAAAMGRLNTDIAIKNNSWGPTDDPTTLGTIGTLMQASLGTAATTGRGGKGVILTWAAGNGREDQDQSNKDAYANNRHVLAVAAMTNTGLQSSYSESGANVVVAAPSSGGTRDIVTTDLNGTRGYNSGSTSGEPKDNNYTNTFGGTSSATPLVSGVVALMLEANPALSYRDVKEILLRTSVKEAPTSTDWIRQTGGRPDLAPIEHHHGFGGGRVDAEAAVAMAEGWTSLPALAAVQSVSSGPLNVVVPDGTGEVSRDFGFGSSPRLRVETVEVTVNIEHAFRGDLEIELVSPKGVRSRLVSASGFDDGYDPDTETVGLGFEPWTFSSVRHWGEGSAGTWKVVVKDKAAQDSGTWRTATVRIYGTAETVPDLTSFGAAQMVAEGDDASFTATATGSGLAYEWRRDGTAVGGTLTGAFTVPGILLSQAGNYTVAAMTSVGEEASLPVPVSVVREENQNVTVVQGRSLTLTATAAGPGVLTYQWKRNNVDMVEGVDGTGTQTRTMVVASAGPDQVASYECVVSDGVRTKSAGVRTVSVTLIPVMQPQVLGNTVISGAPLYSLVALNGATRYVATGVPSGMQFNTLTGELSGRPTRAGTFTIKVYATNTAGRSPTVDYTVTVEELPIEVVNVFRGVVLANAVLNQDLGGSITLTVGKSGSYSGTLVLGGKSYTLRGLLVGLPGRAKPTGSVTIRRTGLSSLVVGFEIDPNLSTMAGSVVAGADVVAWTAQSANWNSKTNPATARYFTVGLGNGGVMPGKGFMTLTVATSGSVRMVGRTGEARPFTVSTVLSRTGEVAVFARTDSTRSSVHGWLTVTDNSYGGPFVAGSLAWRRLVQPVGTRLYAGGFSGTLTVNGSAFVRPGVGAILMGLTAPVLPTDRNAKVEFSGPVVTAAALAVSLGDVRFTLTDKHKAVFAAARSADNAASVKLSVSSTTGLVSGSFVASDVVPPSTKPLLRTVLFYGVVLGTTAEGCFVMPELPDAMAVPPTKSTTSQMVSGGVVIGGP